MKIGPSTRISRRSAVGTGISYVREGRTSSGRVESVRYESSRIRPSRVPGWGGRGKRKGGGGDPEPRPTGGGVGRVRPPRQRPARPRRVVGRCTGTPRGGHVNRSGRAAGG